MLFKLSGKIKNVLCFLDSFELETDPHVYLQHFCKIISVKEIRTPATGVNQEGKHFCCFLVFQEITIVIKIALGCMMICYTR